MKQLVITADDFGADLSVNEAVERGHLEGMLTAASLMVAGPAAHDAVARAQRLPSLRVGLHLVLVDGRPALPPEQLPDLVGADGRFRDDMVGTAIRIFFKPGVRRQLQAEIEAQFSAFAATGLQLDHVNTHKHFHLHPTILSTILEVGARYGMKALRVPAEPRRMLARIEPGVGGGGDWITAPWAGLMRRRLAKRGVLTPDQVFGLAWSGAMTAHRLQRIVDNLPPGLSEIYLHPGLADAYDGSAKGYRYREEFAALTDPKAAAAVHASGAALGGFVDFS